MEHLGKFALWLLSAITCIAASALTSSCLYSWFVARPFGLPHLTVPQVMGLAIATAHMSGASSLLVSITFQKDASGKECTLTSRNLAYVAVTLTVLLSAYVWNHFC